MESVFEREIAAIASRVIDEKLAAAAPAAPADESADVRDLRRKLSFIQAKEFVTIAEAALLLSCSDGHIRNLLDRALLKKTAHPIPFHDLDGVKIFNRVELLEWSRKPKVKEKKKRLHAVG